MGRAATEKTKTSNLRVTTASHQPATDSFSITAHLTIVFLVYQYANHINN